MITAFPLVWPEGRPRTPSHKRTRAAFGRKTRGGEAPRFRKTLSIAEALERLVEELRRLGALYWTLSSNLRLQQDGVTPYSSQPDPADPGVAVYFGIGRDRRYCLACDRYDRAADNLAAVAATIDALRGIERWGAQTTLEAFEGARTSALVPAPKWVEVFGGCRTVEEVRALYREKAKVAHPDRGGTSGALVELRKAQDEALAAIGPGE